MRANSIRLITHNQAVALLTVLLTSSIGQGNAQAQIANGGTTGPSQQQTMAARFEVATIKPSLVTSASGNIRLGGHQVTLENKTIVEVVELAYQVHGGDIVGGPTWFRNQRFDIVGQPGFDAVPNLLQLQEMLKDLLVTRCGLTLHHEQKERPVYVLSIDEKGSKLSQSASSTTGLPTQTGGHEGSNRIRTFQSNSIPDFILGMQGFVDRPLVDKTGLSGHYDFKLKWSPEDISTGSEGTEPELFTAMREQLGLKVKSEREPIEVLVIDAIRQPGAN